MSYRCRSLLRPSLRHFRAHFVVTNLKRRLQIGQEFSISAHLRMQSKQNGCRQLSNSPFTEIGPLHTPHSSARFMNRVNTIFITCTVPTASEGVFTLLAALGKWHNGRNLSLPRCNLNNNDSNQRFWPAPTPEFRRRSELPLLSEWSGCQLHRANSEP